MARPDEEVSMEGFNSARLVRFIVDAFGVRVFSPLCSCGLWSRQRVGVLRRVLASPGIGACELCYSARCASPLAQLGAALTGVLRRCAS
jgi:hypothetical protein